MKYIKRLLLDEIKKWMGRREIIAIRGPRQSGKTTLLKLLSEWISSPGGMNADADHVVYITFEDRGELDAFSVNPKDFVARHLRDNKTYYFLIDEAQYCGDLGQKLKLIYDLFENIKLVITGSSSLELRNQTGKFLVGRILEFELLPLNFYEYLSYVDEGLAAMHKIWNDKVAALVSENKEFTMKEDLDIFTREMLRRLNEFVVFGGYPAVVTSGSGEEKALVLKNLVNTYIGKDIVSFLHITDTVKFRRLITVLAAMDGSMVNMEGVANEVGSYFKELEMLIDVVEETYVIRRVGPYHRNLATELKKAKKVYFVDTGFRNSLVGNFSDMEGRPDAGVLAENFVLNELAGRAKMHFWRTTAKTEVDFVAEGRELLPLEVKYRRMAAAEVTRSLHGFLDEYNPPVCIVATKDFWGSRHVGKTRVGFVPIVYI